MLNVEAVHANITLRPVARVTAETRPFPEMWHVIGVVLLLSISCCAESMDSLQILDVPPSFVERMAEASIVVDPEPSPLPLPVTSTGGGGRRTQYGGRCE